MTHAPDLHTARLHLRAHRLDDAAALHRMWSDPAVVRHLGGEPSRVDESWARLLRYAGMWPLLGFGYWAVTDRDTSIYLGDCGFLLGKRAKKNFKFRNRKSLQTDWDLQTGKRNRTRSVFCHERFMVGVTHFIDVVGAAGTE
jgi:hypothetical protein